MGLLPSSNLVSRQKTQILLIISFLMSFFHSYFGSLFFVVVFCFLHNLFHLSATARVMERLLTNGKINKLCRALSLFSRRIFIMGGEECYETFRHMVKEITTFMGIILNVLIDNFSSKKFENSKVLKRMFSGSSASVRINLTHVFFSRCTSFSSKLNKTPSHQILQTASSQTETSYYETLNIPRKQDPGVQKLKPIRKTKKKSPFVAVLLLIVAILTSTFRFPQKPETGPK